MQRKQNKHKHKNLVDRLVESGIAKDQFMVKCEVCSKHFRGNFELRKHTEIQHLGKRLECTDCNKTYKSDSGYRYHILHSHNQKLSSGHVCGHCNKEFQSNGHLMNHKRSLHGYDKLVCDQCKSTFTYKNNLTRHKKTCKGKRNKDLNCFACGKRFKRTKYLLEHIKGQHRPPRYHCDVCKKDFPYRASFNSHVREHSINEP